jgi:hypothetical protein
MNIFLQVDDVEIYVLRRGICVLFKVVLVAVPDYIKIC